MTLKTTQPLRVLQCYLEGGDSGGAWRLVCHGLMPASRSDDVPLQGVSGNTTWIGEARTREVPAMARPARGDPERSSRQPQGSRRARVEHGKVWVARCVLLKGRAVEWDSKPLAVRVAPATRS